ncbi:hypothetical protein QN362_05125 [Actimicrobium sp. CCC2.4]|uniref:hypothetical protein n=1 Tax=Actimicrobium sp. CCC2.4 TaxID=3048606 RepID=UPI002AC9503C|nr:hypothetical protein [Actimicrobium sp. CCC2.4]MEB0134709.1 hypothetical protein [Actimicrobium sp. CCC2.4]WPX30652.1 hypothetical protein RHM62_10210 [Actimicrobium sp. CCC2.4]
MAEDAPGQVIASSVAGLDWTAGFSQSDFKKHTRPPPDTTTPGVLTSMLAELNRWPLSKMVADEAFKERYCLSKVVDAASDPANKKFLGQKIRRPFFSGYSAS